MWKAFATAGVALCFVFTLAIKDAPALSALAAALLVLLAAAAAPVGQRAAYAGHGLLYGLAFLGAAAPLHLLGALWSSSPL